MEGPLWCSLTWPFFFPKPIFCFYTSTRVENHNQPGMQSAKQTKTLYNYFPARNKGVWKALPMKAALFIFQLKISLWIFQLCPLYCLIETTVTSQLLTLYYAILQFISCMYGMNSSHTFAANYWCFLLQVFLAYTRRVQPAAQHSSKWGQAPTSPPWWGRPSLTWPTDNP